jgi:hypothetical protein
LWVVSEAAFRRTPYGIDKLKLESMGIKIEQLIPEQAAGASEAISHDNNKELPFHRGNGECG